MTKPKILILLSNIASSKLANITGDIELLYSDKATAEAIIKSGAIPLFLPGLKQLKSKEIDQILNDIDGLLLTGQDAAVDPKYYQEEDLYLTDRIDTYKDQVEIHLVKQAVSKDIAILGICKGAQVINVALGGSLYQNLDKQYFKGIMHDPVKKSRSDLTHDITLKDSSLIYEIFQKAKIKTNGGHRQGVKKLSPKLKATGIADDGLVEVFESAQKQFILGLQFHPELRYFDQSFAEVFKTFVKYCTKRARL